jgi:hypothetical protein
MAVMAWAAKMERLAMNERISAARTRLEEEGQPHSSTPTSLARRRPAPLRSPIAVHLPMDANLSVSMSDPHAMDWIVEWETTIDPPPISRAREPEEPYGRGGGSHEPPKLELRPYTREELYRLFRGGEREVDEIEARLVRASRASGGLALRIGQGLRALQKGSRLMRLAFRFSDYAREIGIGRARGYELAAFAEALESRPRLREAVRAGRAKYRAAQEVMAVAVGDAEEYWVEKAASETVRALEKEVQRQTDPHFEEPWFRMVAAMEPEHRTVLDAALELAGRLDPHASECGKFEALARIIHGRRDPCPG